MVAKPLRTKPKSASAERCLRSLGATIDMATPDMETSNCPVRGVLSHGGLRKGNQEVAVITGFYRSPGIAGLYAGFGARELARIIFHTTMHRRKRNKKVAIKLRLRGLTVLHLDLC